ncbi:hypothetical protein vBAfQDWS535_37 [Alcaligenes phage vB_Af_QDWS535]|nr:hypothetical protein vBAfQDWS535_37 [Alcaligenes phage vB_Af_QDWS535]
MTLLFNKAYDGESLYDLGRDVEEALLEEYNKRIALLPKDEHGLITGVITVSIIHEDW